MSDKPNIVREWAAIKVGDVVLASVREVESPEVRPGSPDYRLWAWMVPDEQGRANCNGASKRADCGCRPGKACARAHATAARWWDTWGKREAERFWRARRVQRPGSVNVDDFGEKRATFDEANTDAVRLGFPFVCLYDGHHHERERRDVVVSAGLFGACA